MRETGVAAYASTSGNRGVWMLRRERGEHTEFVMFTLWDSLDAVKAFAGEDYERAVFYPEDDRYLVERDLVSSHYTVEEGGGGARNARARSTAGRPSRRSANRSNCVATPTTT